MKAQWMIVCGLGLALLTAIFAVFNTEDVPLNYGAGELQVPLIVVISAAVLIGGWIVAMFGTVRPYRLQKDRDKLEASNRALRAANESLQAQLTEAQAAYAMMKKEREGHRHEETLESPELPSSLDGSANDVYPRAWDTHRQLPRNKTN
ncbi:lipopolysaccharide assembly LapA domain-containing protein [Paenibacillus sp. HJGM_3]|uniref:LapA family protein n=1 Tax=Paenibacillus sp. HJGM_3 TaxID=3379816 RepID=UPI0038587DF8